MIGLTAIVVLDLLGLLLLVWVLDQIRRDRLYIGYGVIFVVAAVILMPILSLQRIRTPITRWLDLLFPDSALTVLTLCFSVFMFAYILTQTTLLSNRVARAIQRLAIEQAKEQAKRKAESVVRETKMEAAQGSPSPGRRPD